MIKNRTLHLILESTIKQMLVVAAVTENFKMPNACLCDKIPSYSVCVCGTVGVCAVMCCTYIDI